MKKFWPFSFFFIFFASIASYSPYLVLYYQSLSFTGPQIGFLTGVPPLIILFTVPFWTKLADRTNQHKLIMASSLLIAAFCLVVLPFSSAFIVVLGIALLFNVFATPILSFANSATMFMLKEKSDLYGRIRLGGTIGFGVAAMVVGVFVENSSLKAAFLIAAGLLFVGFFISLMLKHEKNDTYQVKKKNQNIRDDFLKNPHWLLFLIIAFAGGVSFNISNSYFFPYMKEIGANESSMGLALTIGTIAEIPVLLFANRLMKRFNSFRLLIFSTMFTGLRLILFALVSVPAVVMIIQTLNGFTFPLLSVAGVSYADQNAPEGMRATAQGLFNAAMMGIGAAVGGFVGGLLLDNMGARGLYLIMGVAILLILAGVMFVQYKFAARLGLSESSTNIAPVDATPPTIND